MNTELNMLEFVVVVLWACKSMLAMKFKDLWKVINYKQIQEELDIYESLKEAKMNCLGKYQ